MTIWARVARKSVFGFLTKWYSNQPAQLQRLARNLKFHLIKSRSDTFQEANNKGADQSARMRRLVCAFFVGKLWKTGFHASRPIYRWVQLIHLCTLTLSTTYFFSEIMGHLNSNSIWKLFKIWERKFIQTVLVTWPSWLWCPFMVNPARIYSWTNRPVTVARKKRVVKWTDHPDMTITVDGILSIKYTNNKNEKKISVKSVKTRFQ